MTTKKNKSRTSKSRPKAARETFDTDAVRAKVLEQFHPRNADRMPYLHLVDLLDRFGPSAGPALARLVAYDASEQVHDRATTLLLIAANVGGLDDARPDSELLDRAAIEIVRALHDEAVPDERKLALGTLLDACGRGFASHDEYRACFRDFDAANERRVRENATSLPDTVAGLDMPLQAIGLIRVPTPAEPEASVLLQAFGIALATAQHNPNGGSAMLAIGAAIATEHGLVPGDVTEALELAAETRSPRAAWFLGELGRWPAMGEAGETARALAHELAGAGVVARPPSCGTFSHGFVSNIDGVGSRSVALFFRDGEGALDAVTLLLNDEVGIKDVWCVFGNGADVEAQFDETGMGLVPCDLAFARALVADAFAIHERNELAVPGRFLLYRPLLGEEAIEPRAREADLSVYVLETLVRSPGMLEGTDLVLRHEAFDELWCSSDRAYAFVKKRRPTKRRGKARIADSLVLDFAREVLIDEKPRILRRLAAALEIEARAGRARKAVNRLAAQAWVALVEEIVPFAEQPFVRELARRSVEAIAHNLDLGLESQRDVNATRGEWDGERSALLAGLFGGEETI